ncbi:MAG: hypothetical protein ACOYO1_09770 [Bacteroidales bacterium]
MKRILFLLMLLPLSGINLQLHAQGDLLVSPVRVVFDGKKQKEEISLVNTGNDTAVYSVSFLQYKMTEDGGFEIITKPEAGQNFADPYLRIFPRKVTLAPREAQVIRLQLRKSPDMVTGEYRSHLYFRAEKGKSPLGMEVKGKDTALMSVQITPVFGISIPIIIQNGDVKFTATLSNLKVEKLDTIQNLKLTINRSGNISCYGDLIAEYIPVSGKAIEIGLIKGIAVYTTVDKRNVSMKINQIKGVDLSKGKIKLRFTTPKDVPFAVYAEQELVL